MSTFADWIVAHRELDADPHTRALRAALTPLNEQNHLPVVHATLGEIWAAEAETKATRFVISEKVRAAAALLISRADDVDIVNELAQRWVVPHGWFEFVAPETKIGLHFRDGNSVDIYQLYRDRYFSYFGRLHQSPCVDDAGMAITDRALAVLGDEEAKTYGDQSFRIFICLMAFLTCPGATTIRRSFHTEKLQRSRRKRTGFGFCSHNIVEFPRSIASESTSDTVAHLTGMMRRHLVRGHFTWRDTPRERWQPAYWRGNAARGVIHKDYYVRELATVRR